MAGDGVVAIEAEVDAKGVLTRAIKRPFVMGKVDARDVEFDAA